LRLVDILSPERVIWRLSAPDKEGVLRELVERGLTANASETGLDDDDTERVVGILAERERLGSTGIKDGLAIPHGKLDGLDHLVACLGLHEDGLEFGALDNKRSRIFIALLAPQGAKAEHLKALARISRVFADGSLSRRLLECEGEQAIYDEIAAQDARL
jgi:PTS system nitrogen regulatory IIA component